MSISHARLLELVDYHEDSGVFTRRIRTSPKTVIGGLTGWTNKQGYVMLCLDSRQYIAHRVAWFYVYGSWPCGDIDHINMNRRDNRISNLRDVTHAENMANDHGPRRNNSSGYRGVDWYKRSYRARLMVNGRLVYHKCGFQTAEEASVAYLEARRRLAPTSSVFPSNPPIKLQGDPV